MLLKSRISNIASMAILLSVAACGSPTENAGTERAENGKSGEAVSQVEVPGNLKFKDDKLNAIYPWYLQLQEALVVEDVAAAQKAAFAIEEGSRQLGGAEGLTRAASEIATASGIDEQRATFQAMAGLMIQEVKSSGLQSGEVYVAHCPMAFDNKGADWLSSTEEIRNPYYGDEMLTCGSVKETI